LTITPAETVVFGNVEIIDHKRVGNQTTITSGKLHHEETS